jgi:hypothetical protein
LVRQQNLSPLRIPARPLRQCFHVLFCSPSSL